MYVCPPRLYTRRRVKQMQEIKRKFLRYELSKCEILVHPKPAYNKSLPVKFLLSKFLNVSIHGYNINNTVENPISNLIAKITSCTTSKILFYNPSPMTGLINAKLYPNTQFLKPFSCSTQWYAHCYHAIPCR